MLGWFIHRVHWHEDGVSMPCILRTTDGYLSKLFLTFKFKTLDWLREWRQLVDVVDSIFPEATPEICQNIPSNSTCAIRVSATGNDIQCEPPLVGIAMSRHVTFIQQSYCSKALGVMDNTLCPFI